MKKLKKIGAIKNRSPKLSHTECYDIIVIGASMGGIQALKQLISEFPADFPAAVFVVLHIGPFRESRLSEILGRNAKIAVVDAKDNDLIRPGCVYVAVPDFHLRIEGIHVRLDHGPRHNFHRPAVDPLFTSAAEGFGPRVIGVVLTGGLDDGTAGLMDIKRFGGLAVVQCPSDAINPSMPASALNCVPVDHCVSLSVMGTLLSSLAGKPIGPAVDRNKKKIPKASKPKLSSHICPECNGPMWFVIDGKLLHFHCRIGHSFSGQSLYVEKTMAIESALWSAVNALKDKADISNKLAKRMGDTKVAENSKKSFLKQAAEAISYANIITDILLGKNSPTDV